VALREATELFGRDPESQDVTRTATYLVFSKQYPSVGAAKEAYDNARNDAILLFGGDPEGREVARTAACLVFTKKYPSMAHAKEAYDTVINEARETFGSNPEHRALVRGRASLAFTRRSPSVLAVKSAQRSASEGGHTPEVRSQAISDAALKTEPQSPRANYEAIGIVSSLLSRDLA
jgi:hypothetical protein